MKKAICFIMSIIILITVNLAFAVTLGEKNALESAKNYLSIMNFSYNGLCSQLEYEGYSKSECIYAADNCGADWFDQAVGSAKKYLELMAFSKQGLIEQLEYEGYTKEQADYGAAIAYGESATKPNSTKGISSTSTKQENAQKNDVPKTVEITGSKIDFSELSFDELQDLYDQIKQELLNTYGWQDTSSSSK